ncbi:hypothetical protein WSK_3394 [Novosphingobium sp. Rr 2-17]|uniref:hypothetical protein n=1 Tax=Novosphingobium sp. Rr 2-17 TaxID=555793 RepID=UPI00026998B4|nr:hypothetical protein [Novosphingobium sp. Rr 2-17]EIZ78084.1 hypothetical protein WSK_3394 [Novosphingobium sp. Rr 2-17]
MRMLSKKYLIGAAALAVLGAGVARAASDQLHTMQVSAADGSVVHVQYSGDVAPKVEVVPVTAAMPAAMPASAILDPFAQMEQVSAMMDAQMTAMMQRAAMLQQHAAQMQQHAVANGQVTQIAPGVTLAGTAPQGVHVTYYSSSTDANGCTRSVSYSSDGTDAAPKMTQAASDGCDANRAATNAIPAKLDKAANEHPASGRKV